MSERRQQIAAGLAAVQERIAGACASVGRSADEVRLIVVTKFFPPSDVRLLADLGVTDVGENRHQEAEAKAAECSDLGLAWHFIGGLQSNKAPAVARYSHAVHSVDRVKLVDPLDRGAHGRPQPLDVLVQVSLDPPGSTQRFGAEPEQIDDLAKRIEGSDHLRLRGLMAVAPLGEPPEEAFGRLVDLRTRFLDAHPEATWLSAGMSADLEAAIGAGATHVRIGSAVLGSRPEVK